MSAGAVAGGHRQQAFRPPSGHEGALVVAFIGTVEDWTALNRLLVADGWRIDERVNGQRPNPEIDL